MKCKSCRKATIVPIYLKEPTGKVHGPYCEPCAERIAAHSRKNASRKEAA